MAMQVTIHEAKTNLSKLIAAVEAGEEVVIARRDKPVVRLVKEEVRPVKRSLGFGAGKVVKGYRMGVDFDDPTLNEEIAEDFEKGELSPE